MNDISKFTTFSEKVLFLGTPFEKDIEDRTMKLSITKEGSWSVSSGHQTTHRSKGTKDKYLYNFKQT